MSDLLVVTTVGTSILSNALDPEDRGFLAQKANEDVLESEDSRRLEAIRGRVASHLDRVPEGGCNALRSASAELNVLSRLSDVVKTHGSIRHLLIATDTAVGRLAAQVLSERLEAWLQICAELMIPDEMRLRSSEELSSALPVLVAGIEGRRGEATQLIFNLAGAFKALSGFLQQAAALWSAKVLYIFETGDELVQIPTLPLGLEMSDQLLCLLRRATVLANGISSDEVVGVSGGAILFSEIEGRMLASDWGKAVWERYREEWFGDKLQESPSSRVAYTDKFRRSVKVLTKSNRALLVEVNETIDDLARWLEKGRTTPTPKRSTVKPLQGRVGDGATHEVYATSDGPAYRLLTCERDGAFELVEMVSHL